MRRGWVRRYLCRGHAVLFVGTGGGVKSLRYDAYPGNSLVSTRRRALATHWIGDDITYNDKPQETDPPYRGEGLVHGGSMECASFPRVR